METFFIVGAVIFLIGVLGYAALMIGSLIINRYKKAESLKEWQYYLYSLTLGSAVLFFLFKFIDSVGCNPLPYD